MFVVVKFDIVFNPIGVSLFCTDAMGGWRGFQYLEPVKKFLL